MPHSNGVRSLADVIAGLMAGSFSLQVGSPEDDLLATGVLDSMTLIQLLSDLEGHFAVRIPLEELRLEDVRSISSIAHMVENYQFTQSGGVRIAAMPDLDRRKEERAESI